MKNLSTSKAKIYSSFILIASTLFLTSCATEQYYQAERECRSIAYQHYPARYQRMLVDKSHWEDVPDGYECKKNISGESCRVHTKQVKKHHKEWEDVDINESARNSYISHCAAQVCRQRYGNADCEVR